MSELIFSNFYPAELTDKNIYDVMLGLIKNSSSTTIASGYISNDAITEINKFIVENRDKIESFSLLIGMHYIEGFTKNQYIASQHLNSFLKEENMGGVYVSPNNKFHGKIYCFTTSEGVNNGLIGSANLSSFIKNLDRTYETMFLIDEPSMAKNLLEKTQKLISSIGIAIDEAEPLTDADFIVATVDLSNFENVDKLDELELNEIYSDSDIGEYTFEIPLSVDVEKHSQSNLNVFFGKGRENSRGFIIPRPWYEVELIVSKKYTSLEGYPRNKTFTVITNDGWQFECKTQGDYSKNLRSTNNLSILGKWIKGKLEISGALNTGEPVTPKVLEIYGRNSITLKSTRNPNIWLLEF